MQPPDPTMIDQEEKPFEHPSLGKVPHGMDQDVNIWPNPEALGCHCLGQRGVGPAAHLYEIERLDEHPLWTGSGLWDAQIEARIDAMRLQPF